MVEPLNHGVFFRLRAEYPGEKVEHEVEVLEDIEIVNCKDGSRLEFEERPMGKIAGIREE